MTAPHPMVASASVDPPTLADVDAMLACVPRGWVLDEPSARVDLSSLRHGPCPDAWWAARWGWTAQDVHELRTTDWRTRAPLPHPRPSRDPAWREPRRRRSSR